MIRIAISFVLLFLCTFANMAHSAITYVASTTENGNNDDVTITVPASVQTNDLLLVQITIRDRNGSDGVTPPAGWTQIGTQDRDDDVLQSLYYRVANAGDVGTDYNFDFDGNGNRRYIAGMSVFRGVDTLNPVEAENSQVGLNWGSATAPSVNVSNAGGMLVAFYTLEAGNGSFFTPLGMTEMYDLEEHNDSDGLTSMAAYELRNSAGASADRVATASKNFDDAIGHLISLREGAALSPSVDNVHGACGIDDLMVVEYDNAIGSDELDPSYYTLNSGSVTSVRQQSTNTVVLSTNGVVPGQAYTLTVNSAATNVDFTGLTGHYFDQRNGSGTKVSQPTGLFTGNEFLRKDAQIDFSWGSGTPTIYPNTSGNNDRFSIRWSGFLVPSQSGSYEFRLRSDDGVRLDLSGSQIISDWSLHGPRYSNTSAAQALAAGQGYELQMEFFEHTGGAVAELEWRRDGGSWQNVPSSALSSCAATSTQASLTGLLNVDNRFDAYISTDDNVQGTLLGSGSNWQTTNTITTNLADGQDYYLHIYARDQGGVAGFLGEFTLSGTSHTFENNATTLLTNGSDWRVSTSGWSNYQSVSTYGSNGVAPWSTRPSVDSSAVWIWSSDNDADNFNYFTTRISAVSSANYLVTSVHGACGVDNLLIVEFDSTIDADALDTAYYSLNTGTVSSVTQQSDTTVVLQVVGLEAGQAYTLTVDGVDHSVDFAGLTAHYFDQRNGSGTKVSQPGGLFTGNEYLRSDAQVNFDWNAGTPTIFPSTSGNNERFSVRWNGYLVPVQEGDYEFRLRSDDGIRLDLDGTEIVNDWSIHAPRYSGASAVQGLNAGQGYPLEIEYFEHTGQAVAALQWRRNGGSWEAVPAVSLSSCATTGVLPEPVADYRMDESDWSGASGDVVDSSANASNADSQNGLDTTSTAHLCRAGDFDGVNDYIESAVAGSTLNGTSSLSFWLRTTQVGSETIWTAPGISGVEESGGTDDIFWGWLDSSGHIGISVGNDNSSHSNTVINDGSYHHVVLTRDSISGAYKIYIDGSLDASGVTGTGIIGTPFSSIGRRENGSNGYFQGQLDEVKIYDRILNDAQVTELYNETRACAGYVITGNDSSLSSSSGAWSWDGAQHVEWRAAMEDTSNFGPGGIVDTPVDTIDITTIDSATLAGVNAFVSSWWSESQSAPYHSVISNWFLAGGDLVIFADSSSRDGLSSQLGLNTSNTSTSSATSVSDPIDTVFGAVGSVLPAGQFGYFNSATITALGGTICGEDALGRATIACWAEGEYAPGAGTLVIAADTDYVTSSYGGANYTSLNDKGRLGLNIIEFLINDDTPPSSCTLGSFDITPYQTVGLACPSTRVQVGIQAMCDDGSTPKTDYAGTINLSTNGSIASNSEFYAASSGGSEISSLTLDGSDNGTANVYLYYKNDNQNLRVIVSDTSASVSSTAATAVDFRTEGFRVTGENDFACGDSNSIMITAIGQTDNSSGACSVLTGFDGGKSLKVWSDINIDPVGVEVKDTGLPLNMTFDGSNIGEAKPIGGIVTTFNSGQANVNLGYLDVGSIMAINIVHEESPYDTSGDELIGASSAFTVYPDAIVTTVDNADPSCSAANAAAANCDVVAVAGSPFAITTQALCSDGSLAQSYQGVIDLTHQKIAPSAVGTSLGNLGLSSVEFTGAEPTPGEVSTPNQTISEVGVFTLTASPRSPYFGYNISTYSSTTPNMGRFTPASFDLSFDPAGARFTPGCAAGAFHYMNQTFQWDTAPRLTIEAHNAFGAVTQNYQGAFWKLGASLQLDADCGGTASTEGFCYNDDAIGGASLSVPGGANDVSYGTPTGGVVTIDMHPAFSFSYNRPTGTNLQPFLADIDLDVSVEDSDNIVGAASEDDMAFMFGSELRQGRWKMENAFGPDTQALNMKAYLEYFSSAGVFVPNTSDQCTSISPTVDGSATLTNIPFNGGSTTLSVSSPLTDAQNENFSFSAPGAGRTGTLEVAVDLSSQPWLRFDWDGDGSLDDHPTVEAQFGQYRGHDRIIYWREVTQ